MSISDRRITIFDLNHDEQDALDVLVKQWRDKRPRNNLRTAFYDMKNSERELFAEQVPDVVRRRSFVLGWSALAVDKLNRRCDLEGFYDAAGADLDALGLDEVTATNRLLQELPQGTHASLLHGPAFVVTTQGDVGAGEPRVLMHARSAELATGVWDARRRAISSFLSITSLDDSGEPTGMTMYLPNVNVTMTKHEGAWTVERRSHSYGVPVDMLRYRARLGRPFGASRINRTVMSLHMQALAAMIRADVNGEAYSLPRFMLLGASEDAFRNADGSPKPSWKAAWDSVWAIGDDPDQTDPRLARAEVKQFSGQSPEPQNSQLRMLGQMFAGETGIPLGEIGFIGDSNPTSADALVVSRDDLIAEARQAMRGWSPDLSSATVRALEMHQRRELPDLRVRPRWGDPVMTSPTAKADAGMKVIAAQPWLGETEVGLELLGLSQDQIHRAMSDRRRSAGSDVLEALAAEVGGGAQVDAPETAAEMKAKFDALGSAIRAGVDPEDAAQYLGLAGLEFTGATPVSLRLPESQAQRLEGK